MEDYKGLRPFYCRVGSKWRIRKYIIKNIPEHYTYVEPFAGSAAIMWSKKPSYIEVINDKDKSLIDDYKLLKTIKDRKLPNANYFKSIESMNNFYNNAPNTPINKLIKSLLLRCNTYSNKAVGVLYKKGSPLTKLKKLDEYQARLKKIKIYNKSYETIIQKYDSPETFFYLDPPYEKSKGLYKNHIIDYHKMRTLLDNVKGKWLLSINDSPFIRKIFKGYYYKIIKVKSVGGVAIGTKPRNELIFANYPLL